MSHLEVNGVFYPLVQRRFLFPSFDLISWISEQVIYPKVFWKDRESFVTRVALGSLLDWDHLPSFTSTEDVRLYGGIPFDPERKKEGIWEGFEKERFWLPQCELVQRESGTELILYSLSHEPSIPPRLYTGLSQKTPPSSSFLDREESPTAREWEGVFERVLQGISDREIEKLILVRKTTLHYLVAPSPWDILKQLMAREMRTTVFAFQFHEKSCFLGLTPEKLFEQKGDLLIADALAGTRPRGKTRAEDKQLEQDLLCHPKEKKEFFIVKKFLENALGSYTEEMHWEKEDKVLKTTYVQHLYNRLFARLNRNVTARELLYLLHPTPALGGNPRKEALSLIRELEPFDRGWYGAPVGVVSQDSASFAVAIRSAFFREDRVDIFAGVGIVEGSQAHLEWEELNHKMAPFLETAFGIRLCQTY